jgi:predicted nucleic acid-binding protein
LGYHGLSANDKLKIKEFLNECIIIDINDGIKLNIIEIRTSSNIKLPDAIIAGTSIFYDLPLFSADKGLQKIENLKLVFYTE